MDNKQPPTVVNKYKEPFDVYIGRGSIWGNPFPMQDKTDAERERVIAEYEAYIRNDPFLRSQIPSLAGKTLGCFCKPKHCHGDVIVKLFQEIMGC